MTCVHCKRDLPDGQFYVADKATGRRRTDCVDCVKAKVRANRQTPRGRALRQARMPSENAAARAKKRDEDGYLRPPPDLKDLTGMVFGRLTVTRRIPNTSKARSRWECVCECGAVKIALGANLRSGHTASCGAHRSGDEALRAYHCEAAIDGELWCDVRGTGYLVSDHGRVRNASGQPIVPWRARKGYLLVDVAGASRQVHRLVLEAFSGETPDGAHAHHRDGDPSNNRLANLEWRDAGEHVAAHRRGTVNQHTTGGAF